MNKQSEIKIHRSADFKKLAQECGTDKQAFADGVKENSFGELIEKSSQHPKSLVSESIANEILELMQTRPKECLSYYIFTNERGQSYQVFEYKGMCYIQQITKQEELISFYPISKEDLKRIYPEVIIDKIPIWK